MSVESEILSALAAIDRRLALIEKNFNAGPEQVTVKDFCEKHAITRKTMYAWSKRGLIKLVKKGGRCYVHPAPVNEIQVKKYGKVLN